VSRGAVYFSFSRLFDRITCATVADLDLARRYLAELETYVAHLEADLQAIDQWSVSELQRALEYLRNNQQWVLGGGEVLALLQGAHGVIDRHKTFLRERGILPDYLAP
jgi:hypothetical protein